MTNTMMNHPDPSDEERTRLVEQLMPSKLVFDLASSIARVNADTRAHFETLKAERDAERANLLALSLSELRALQCSRMQAAAAQKAASDAAEVRRKAEAADREAKKEAARIFNLPKAH